MSEKRTTTRVVAGYVWCDVHCGIHEDSTDPYGCGYVDCPETEHRSVLVRCRPDEEFS